MNRTFHHHISAAAVLSLALLGFLTLFFFWHRESAMSLLVGLALAALLVVVMERLLHTEYVFSGGNLVVSRGRFSRRVTICTGEITTVRRIQVAFGAVSYLLISYGAGHQLAVQPSQEEAFLGELARRQQTNFLTDEDN